jgi:hypothetical protein
MRVLCRSLKLTENFDYKYLARNTPGYVVNIQLTGKSLMADNENQHFFTIENVPYEHDIHIKCFII